VSRRNEQQLSSRAAQLEGPGDDVGEEEVEHPHDPPLRIMADRDFTSLVGKITKLKGASNYRTWAKSLLVYSDDPSTTTTRPYRGMEGKR